MFLCMDRSRLGLLRGLRIGMGVQIHNMGDFECKYLLLILIIDVRYYHFFIFSMYIRWWTKIKFQTDKCKNVVSRLDKDL